jgi:hypothetical protein
MNLRINIVKDERGEIFEDFDSVLNRLKNQFCQLLNVPRVNDDRWIEIHLSPYYLSQVPLN